MAILKFGSFGCAIIGAVTTWILATNLWADSGAWDDNETWND